FRKKGKAFFPDKTGDLLNVKLSEFHRHVLRCVELGSVLEFIRQLLDHCSAEIW
ncbi:hypothetical protein Angca_001171, partial [Angiostrongylus cantonensis]